MPKDNEHAEDNSGEDTADKIRAGLKDDGSDDQNDNDDNSNADTDKTPKNEKPSDTEAKLLKELMKHKKAAKDAAEALKNVEKKFEGLNVDEIRTLLEKREADETTALEKKGEYERLLTKQKEAAQAKIDEEKKRADAAEQRVADMMKNIEELTTGQAFNNSKFVTEKLTLTPSKAKALYKGHFEFEEGKMVAYDKPKGEGERTPIVGADGEPVSFEAAIEAIINADPDKEYLIKAEIKPGSHSKPSKSEPKPKQEEFYDTTDKIAAGLEFLINSQKKK